MLSKFSRASSPMRRTAGLNRSADLSSDPQCRSAFQGLRRHRAEVPAGSRRLHLSGQIRHPRLSRRRTILRARDGDAVAAGAIARQVLGSGIMVRGALVQMARSESIARGGTGMRSTIIRSSVPTLSWRKSGKDISMASGKQDRRSVPSLKWLLRVFRRMGRHHSMGNLIKTSRRR